MGDGQMMSELYQENMKRQNKNRRRKDAAAFLCILLGSLIVAVNIIKTEQAARNETALSRACMPCRFL